MDLQYEILVGTAFCQAAAVAYLYILGQRNRSNQSNRPTHDNVFVHETDFEEAETV